MVGGPTHTGREKYNSGKGVVYLMKAKNSILTVSREDAAGKRERLQEFPDLLPEFSSFTLGFSC